MLKAWSYAGLAVWLISISICVHAEVSQTTCLERLDTKEQEEGCLALKVKGLDTELAYYYGLGLKKQKGKFTKQLTALQYQWQQEKQKCADSSCLLASGKEYRFKLMKIAYGGRLHFKLVEDMSTGVCPLVTTGLNKIKDFPYPMVDEGDADDIKIKGLEFFKFTDVPNQYKEDIFKRVFLNGWGKDEEKKQILINQLQQGLFEMEYNEANALKSDFVGLARLLYNRNIIIPNESRVQHAGGIIIPIFKNHDFMTRKGTYIGNNTGVFAYKENIYVYGVSGFPESLRSIYKKDALGFLIVSYVNNWMDFDESLLSVR